MMMADPSYQLSYGTQPWQPQEKPPSQHELTEEQPHHHFAPEVQSYAKILQKLHSVEHLLVQSLHELETKQEDDDDDEDDCHLPHDFSSPLGLKRTTYQNDQKRQHYRNLLKKLRQRYIRGS